MKGNHVDGPTATRFLLSCLRQRLLSPGLLPKLERRLRKLAMQSQADRSDKDEATELRAKLAQVQSNLGIVSRNMALAATPEQFQAISATFGELKTQENALQSKITEATSQVAECSDLDAEIGKAIDAAHRLTDLAGQADRLDLATQLFQNTNARLFLRFQPMQVKKRLLNKVAGGVVTFGSIPPPINIYGGPTGRRALNDSGPAVTLTAEPGKLDIPTPPKVLFLPVWRVSR